MDNSINKLMEIHGQLHIISTHLYFDEGIMNADEIVEANNLIANFISDWSASK